MEQFWQLYKNKAWVEPFLIYSILLFVVASTILYFLIIRSRAQNIKNERLKAEYTLLIEKLLFSMLFNDISYSAIKDDQTYKDNYKKKFFREILAELVINLHQNYEGIYATKLECFYYESGLLKDSFKKLKSKKWEINCKGVRELSEMNATKAFNSLVKISKSRNKTLKITALNACIKLNGTRGIIHLIDHPDPIDEWTQVNIIGAIKKHDTEDTKGIEQLLESQNTSVVALGLKIIKALKLSQNAPHVANLAVNSPNNSIKFEAQSVLQILTL